jgi:hypothetical protein
MTKKIELHKDKSTEVHTLVTSGQAMPCAFKAPIPVPHQLAGQINLVSPPCTSLCPLFSFTESSEGYVVLINCGCKQVVINAVKPNVALHTL